MRRPTALLTLAAVLGAVAWTVAAPAPAALADARVSVANEDGASQADLTFSTPLTVTGSGFQAVQGAFGGVYVAFGTVGPGWRPSRGGVSGVDFRYVPDAEAQDNAGFQRYVSFPGSSTAGEAHATMSGSGGWTVTLTVPGPTFQTTGRSGKVETVDCREVTCGVITFGAHGVTNARNETFTPVSFVDLGAKGGEPVEDGASEADDADDDGDVPEADEEPALRVEPELEVDAATAVVGRVLTFTARGFTPGEQVVGALGAGLAAVGPLVVGAHGEVAGALQLPADLRAGTHQLSLSGAASGIRVTEELQLSAAPAPALVAPSPQVDESGWPSGEWIALGTAALVLLVVLLVGAVTGVRERRTRRSGGAVAR